MPEDREDGHPGCGASISANKAERLVGMRTRQLFEFEGAGVYARAAWGVSVLVFSLICSSEFNPLYGVHMFANWKERRRVQSVRGAPGVGITCINTTPT